MPDPLAGAPPDPAMAPPAAAAPPAPIIPAQSPMAAPAQPSAIDQHHNMLGRAVKHIAASLEGNSISYVPDATTGEAQEVVTKRSPGGFFRDLLLSAALGGAAGASAPNRESAIGGASLGGAAAIQQQQAMQQRQQQQAQEKAQRLKNLAEANEKKQTDKELNAATNAHNTISDMAYDHSADLYTPTQHDSHNKSAEVVMGKAKELGGVMVKIPGADGEDLIGKVGTGKELLDKFNKDPQSVMQAPDGSHRIHFSKIDYTGLTYKPGQGYFDKDGKYVDLADRTTHYLMDLPNEVFGKAVSATKGDFNTVAGSKIMEGKDTDPATSNFGQLFGLRTKNIGDMNKARAELHAPPQSLEEARSWKSWIDGVRADKNATDEDKRRADIKEPMVNSRLQQEEDKPNKPLTPEQDKLRTRDLNKQLKAGTISADDREDLVSRQQEAKLTGVDSGIASQVGKPPVPAQFPKGEDDPAFKAQDKAWGQKVTKLQTAKNTAGVSIRMQAFEDVPYNVINTKDNSMGVMTRGELAQANKQAPGQYLLATQDGLKVKGKAAAIQDIEYNLKNSEDTIGALDNLNPATRTKLAMALRSADPHSALSTLVTSEAREFSDPKLQDAVIALTSMAENVMLLRSIQGVGGAGSDMMRHALMDLVPSAASPTKGYALKQLKIVRGTLDRLKTGVPNTGVQPPQGGGGTPQPSAAPQGRAVVVNGKTVGYTTDGKTMTPAPQQ